MRVNVYNEELTEEVEIAHVFPNGNHFIGLRFLLESADKLHHREGDDDRSAVTFWVGDRDRGRRLLQNALDLLDREEASSQGQEAGVAVTGHGGGYVASQYPLQEPLPLPSKPLPPLEGDVTPSEDPPTIGRIVHYTGFGDAQGGECYAAIITKVRDHSIDLTIFPPDNRQPFPDRDVTGGGNEPGNGQWHWPKHTIISYGVVDSSDIPF